MNSVRILILNLLLLLCVYSNTTGSINNTLDSSVNTLFVNISKQNLSDQNGVLNQIEPESNQTEPLLLADKSRNESIESNLTALATDIRTVDSNATQMPVIKSKSVNRRSAPKLYGYFDYMGKYHDCPEPTNKIKGQTAEQDPSLSKCLYMNGDELEKKFGRKFQSNNEWQGVWGKYKYGKFQKCKPEAPSQLVQDPNDPKIKYIPFRSKFDWECNYFDNDPGTKFDAVYLNYTSSLAVQAHSTVPSSIITLSTLVLFSMY